MGAGPNPGVIAYQQSVIKKFLDKSKSNSKNYPQEVVRSHVHFGRIIVQDFDGRKIAENLVGRTEGTKAIFVVNNLLVNGNNNMNYINDNLKRKESVKGP